MSFIPKRLFSKAVNYVLDKARILRALLRGYNLKNRDYIFKNRFGVWFYLPNYHEDLIQRLIIKNEFYDYDSLNYLRKYISDDSIIMDIGANIGNHSLYFARFCKPGHVYAFEPVPATYEILARNIELNNYGEVISIYNYGVGRAQGFASIASFNKENIGGTELKEDENGNIELLSIDSFSPHLIKLDFMKIDVEGFEIQVLEGAERTIQRFKPTISIEIFEENFENINQWLNNRGYKMKKKYGYRDYVYQND